MSTKFLHPAGHGRAARHDSRDEQARAYAETGRACCCPAWPVVRAIMPATARRPHQTELMLCAHHYRVSRRALDAAGAVILVLPGCPDDALLYDQVPESEPLPG